MAKISSVVITFNEENNIKDCLESIKWSDEIIIVDSKSSDKTVEIASQYSDNIISTDNLPFGVKKNIGIQHSSNEWILSIDADERVTEVLKNEILSIINSENKKYDAYLINRKSFFINKFIKHCGWYPDYVLRLFKNSSGIRFGEELVHEKLISNGKAGKIKAELLHYTDKDFEHYLNKLNKYTTYSAEELIQKGKKSGIFDILFRPAFTFFKMYFLKLGFLDGFTGLVLCYLSSVHVFLKYSKIYFKTKKNTNGKF